MSTGRRPAEHTQQIARLSQARRVLDLAALSVLMLIGMVGFHPVYGGGRYVLAGVAALVLGLLIALIGARFRWGPLRLLALLIVAHFLFGSMFAAPARALWGILPTAGSLKDLLVAPVSSWKTVLTTPPPVGSAQGVLAVVWISMLLLAVPSASILLRSRHDALAWMFPFVLILATVLFGTTEDALPVLRGVLFAIISVAWLSWRADGTQREVARRESAQSAIVPATGVLGSWANPVLRRRAIGGAVTLALAGGATIGAQPLLDPPEATVRYAHRDTIVPPFDPQEYVSPLAEFRGYLKQQRSDVLFTVTGLEDGDRVRLATMDLYDLQVYNVAGSDTTNEASGAFLRSAAGVDLERGEVAARTSTLTIGAYSGVWLPTLGVATERIDLDDTTDDRVNAAAGSLYLNEKSQTMVNSAGVQEGDTYVLGYQPYTAPTLDQQRTARFAELQLPPAPRMGQVTQLAEEWAGGAVSDYEKITNLTRALRTRATFSHGIDDGEAASLSGHGAGRLLTMVEPVEPVEPVGPDGETTPEARTEGLIGDEEQFAALTALMARSIGIPARVVMGFEVEASSESAAGSTGAVEIIGADVTAWVEVAFDGDLGWVRFDVAPGDGDQTVPAEPSEPAEPPEISRPLPVPAEPPPSTAELPTSPPGAMSDDAAHDGLAPERTASASRIASTATLLLAGLALAVVVIGKRARRRYRRTRGSPPTRIDGGWQEFLDHLADLGYRLDPGTTRAEAAAGVHRQLPALWAPLLAARADRAVFGPDDLPEGAAEEYWEQVAAARQTMAASVPWHRRLRGELSLRSFRRRFRRSHRGSRRRTRSTRQRLLRGRTR